MKTFGKRPNSCPRLRAKDSYAKLVEDREQKQRAWAKSVQRAAQRDIDDIFAPIQQSDEKNVDEAEIDPLAAEIRRYEAEGWIAPPENNNSDIDDYYEDYSESESGDEEDEEDEEDEDEGDPHEHREVIERVDEVEVCELGDGKNVEEGDPHQRHEVVERVDEVPLVSRTYTKDDEEVTLTLTLT